MVMSTKFDSLSGDKWHVDAARQATLRLQKEGKIPRGPIGTWEQIEARWGDIKQVQCTCKPVSLPFLPPYTIPMCVNRMEQFHKQHREQWDIRDWKADPEKGVFTLGKASRLSTRHAIEFSSHCIKKNEGVAGTLTIVPWGKAKTFEPIPTVPEEEPEIAQWNDAQAELWAEKTCPAGNLDTCEKATSSMVQNTTDQNTDHNYVYGCRWNLGKNRCESKKIGVYVE